MNLMGDLAVGIGVASLALSFIAPAVPARAARHPEAAMLAQVAPSLTPLRWELLRAAFVAVGCAALTPVVGLAPGAALGALAPTLVLRSRYAAARARAAARSLEVLQATHAALRSGLPLASALRLALDGADPMVRAPFDRALRAFELNAGLESALADAREEAGDQRVRVALEALALVAAERLPATRAAAVIGGVAERLAYEQRLVEEVRARTSGVRAQIFLLALLVPAIAVYLAVTMPGLAATLGSPLGSRVLVPAAAAFEIAGIIASHRMSRGLPA